MRSPDEVKNLIFSKNQSYNSKSTRGILMKFIAHIFLRLLSNIDNNQRYISINEVARGLQTFEDSHLLNIGQFQKPVTQRVIESGL